MNSLFNIKIITTKDDFNFNVEIFVSRNKTPNFLALGHMALFFKIGYDTFYIDLNYRTNVLFHPQNQLLSFGWKKLIKAWDDCYENVILAK